MDDVDRLLDAQLEHFGRRAATYDDAYARTGHHDRGAEANARWFAELAAVEAELDAARLDGDVLELGCGTGHWTARLAATARSVTALDGAAPMLEVARTALPATTAPNVTFELVDVVRDWAPSRTYDAVTAFFFLEHVPDAHLDSLIARIASALRPEGTVFVAEGRHHPPDTDPASPHDQDHDHEPAVPLVVHRRGEAELVGAFARHGIGVTFTATPHLFCIVQGALRPTG